MGRTKAVAVEMERSQSEDAFWSLNDEDLMMGVEAERKRKDHDSQVSDVSSCVTGGTIYDTEKTGWWRGKIGEEKAHVRFCIC